MALIAAIVSSQPDLRVVSAVKGLGFSLTLNLLFPRCEILNCIVEILINTKCKLQGRSSRLLDGFCRCRLHALIWSVWAIVCHTKLQPLGTLKRMAIVAGPAGGWGFSNKRKRKPKPTLPRAGLYFFYFWFSCSICFIWACCTSTHPSSPRPSWRLSCPFVNIQTRVLVVVMKAQLIRN